jgi:hypothetical protein
MEEKKTFNFTFVPDDSSDLPRVYSNMFAVQHSPFDFTFTFCDMIPPTERDLQTAQTTHVVKAPVRARIVLPVGLIPTIISLLQENFRLHQEAFGPPRGGLQH